MINNFKTFFLNSNRYFFYNFLIELFETIKLHSLFEASMLPLTVSSLMRSQEEQFFINGNLPEFHLADIPDIWIGLSGSQHAILVLFPLSLSLLKRPLSSTRSRRCSPDKDQDGHFRWVDKTEVTFSNYGPGWPRNTDNIWDCGQIFTGETGNTGARLRGPSESSQLLLRVQGTTTACGKPATA